MNASNIAAQNIATFTAAENKLRDLRMARKAKIKNNHEGDNGMATEYDRKIGAAVKACIAAEAAMVADKFNAEWTLEVTTARRADWNDWVTSAKPTTFAQKLDHETLIGFTFEAMKAAVAHHNL